MKNIYKWMTNEKDIWMNDEWKRHLNEWCMKKIYKWMINEKDIWIKVEWKGYMNE